MKNKALIAISLTLLAPLASAYVGPGAGISLLGSLWGLIVAVVLAIGMVLFWPIRIMLRKRKAAQAEAADTAPAAGNQTAQASQPAAEENRAPEQ